VGHGQPRRRTQASESLPHPSCSRGSYYNTVRRLSSDSARLKGNIAQSFSNTRGEQKNTELLTKSMATEYTSRRTYSLSKGPWSSIASPSLPTGYNTHPHEATWSGGGWGGYHSGPMSGATNACNTSGWVGHHGEGHRSHEQKSGVADEEVWNHPIPWPNVACYSSLPGPHGSVRLILVYQRDTEFRILKLKQVGKLNGWADCLLE
jgi:hypothetical protein